MSPENSVAGVDVARTEIDRLDNELLQVLAARMRVVREVGRLKSADGDALLLDPERERALLARWQGRAQESGLSAHFAGRVLREVLSFSRRTQEADFSQAGARGPGVPRVGYQGEPCSYSDLAAQQLFDTRPEGGCERIGFRSCADAVLALGERSLDYALLPAENSIAGSIPELGQLLAEHDLHIVDEEIWAVRHVLALRPGEERARIRRVRSHPVALAQCGRFLASLNGAICEPWHDTAGAAASLAECEEEGVAVIASEEAARAHGLHILRRDVADRETNVTRFLLLAREAQDSARGVPSKTSLLLTLDHRRGALARVLNLFAEASINLTRIESRADPETPWRYRFFIDLEGHREEPPLQALLLELRRHCNHLRVLGCYPLRTAEGEHLRRAPMPNEPSAPPAVTGCPATPKRAQLEPRHQVAPRTQLVSVGGVPVGGEQFTLILGPCAVESRAQIEAAAEMVRRAGAHMMRAGAFKPRTSPHSFQGLGQEGLDLLQAAGRSVELPVVTELMRIEDLDAVVAAADLVQVGARNMQNFSLLRALGRIDRPVLLKRGLSATVAELLSAAEYITAGGNQRVILCERGIRTFETATRSTLDLGAVVVLKQRTHLPVLVDPSHAAGARELVVPLALAAAAAGADGLIIEAHPHPETALCDKEQALTEADLVELVAGLRPILAAKGRTL